jgi:hypothetical protein
MLPGFSQTFYLLKIWGFHEGLSYDLKKALICATIYAAICDRFFVSVHV